MKVIGDSQLVIKYVVGEYRCKSPNLQNYLDKTIELLTRFREVEFVHLSREENEHANDLAQSASGYKEPRRISQVKIEKKLLLSVHT